MLLRAKESWLRCTVSAAVYWDLRFDCIYPIRQNNSSFWLELYVHNQPIIAGLRLSTKLFKADELRYYNIAQYHRIGELKDLGSLILLWGYFGIDLYL
jgi:hypothetical protein